MPFTQDYFQVIFGPGFTGLATVGYTLRQKTGAVSVARTTVGVAEEGTATGVYGVPDVAVPDNAFSIHWDTGGGSPIDTAEDLEPFRKMAELEAKLPTNFIMGSSDQTDKDDEIDDIKAVTDLLPNAGALTDIDTGVNAIEAKLPTNFIMGSSDQTDKDDEIDAILVDTGAIDGRLPPDPADASDVAAAIAASESAIRGADSDDLKSISDQIDAVPTVGEIDTQLSGTHGSGAWDGTESDWTTAEREQIRFRLAMDGSQTDPTTGIGTIEDILADTDETQSKLPTNEIMGSSDKSDKDDEIDAIKAVTDNLPNSGALSDIDTGVNAIEAKLPTNFIMGSSDQSDKDDEIDAILADTSVMEPIVSTNLDVLVSSRATPADVSAAVATIIARLDKLNVAAETAATGTPTATNIQTGLTQADDFFNNMQLVVINSAGVAVRNINDYIQANGEFIVDALPFTPIATDPVIVLARTGSVPVDASAIAAAVDVVLTAAHGLGLWQTADVSLLALEANVEGHAGDALTSYDPPTRAEATSDKDEIITEVDANETKIDAVQTKLNTDLDVAVSTRAIAGDAMALTPAERVTLSDAIRVEIMTYVVNGNVLGLTVEQTLDMSRKILNNNLALADGTTGNWILLDDDDSSTFLTWSVADKAGNAIFQPATFPSRRTRGV